jgi:hypothetical protein
MQDVAFNVRHLRDLEMAIKRVDPKSRVGMVLPFGWHQVPVRVVSYQVATASYTVEALGSGGSIREGDRWSASIQTIRDSAARQTQQEEQGA